MSEKEYIERGALIDKMSKLKTGGIFTEVFKKVVLEIISNQPTADVQEVRHAHWEYFFDIEEMARCSNCYEVLKKGRASCYCPHCGTKMDKE